MAVLTGATVVSNELGVPLEQVQLSQLGRAHRVVVQKDSTALIGGAGTREAIEARLQQIRGQVDSTTSDYDREKLQERLARLGRCRGDPRRGAFRSGNEGAQGCTR